MKTLFSSRVDKSDLHSVELTENGMDIVHIPYEGIFNIPRRRNELDDLMADYLSAASSELEFIRNLNTEEEKEILTEAGYDLDLEIWAVIKCPYLPFVDWLYIPEGWII